MSTQEINFITAALDFLVHHLSLFTVAFALLFALIAICIKAFKRDIIDLEFILSSALSGSAIPTGIALLYCAFNPSMLKELSDGSLYIAIAGITLLIISCKSVFKSSSKKARIE